MTDIKSNLDVKMQKRIDYPEDGWSKSSASKGGRIFTDLTNKEMDQSAREGDLEDSSAKIAKFVEAQVEEAESQTSILRDQPQITDSPQPSEQDDRIQDFAIAALNPSPENELSTFEKSNATEQELEQEKKVELLKQWHGLSAED
jgi:hypothetical protein